MSISTSLVMRVHRLFGSDLEMYHEPHDPERDTNGNAFRMSVVSLVALCNDVSFVVSFSDYAWHAIRFILTVLPVTSLDSLSIGTHLR